MSKVKLPVCNPPIKVYVSHAYILSVLLNEEEAKNWFYSNYIQVKYIRRNEYFFLNYSLGNLSKYYYNIPFLEVRSLSRKFVLECCGDVISFICNTIKNGYYVMTIADEYYLSPRWNYHSKHYMHLIMLNGYDKKEKCFYCMGYNGNKYESAKISFDEFRAAFTSKEGNNSSIRDDSCILYKLQDKSETEFLQDNYNYFPYKLNIKLIKQSLLEYLNSVCSDEHFSAFYEIPSDTKYGISYYLALIKFIQDHIENPNGGYIYKVVFHGMLEHKEVMLQRLKYMQQKGYIANIEKIISTYVELAHIAERVRNLILKYSISKNIELLKRVKVYLEEMYISEKSAIKELIDIL